jgi:hypothetical protein
MMIRGVAILLVLWAGAAVAQGRGPDGKLVRVQKGGGLSNNRDAYGNLARRSGSGDQPAVHTNARLRHSELPATR